MLEINVVDVTPDNYLIGPECYFYNLKHEIKLSRNVALQDGINLTNL